MRILFFSRVREITGCRETTLCGGELGADELWRQLVERYPGLAVVRSSVRLARNSEFVGPEARFGDADEVALIPPVSGG